MHVPLDVVCDVVTFFECVEEVTCVNIRNPLQVCLCNVCYLHTQKNPHHLNALVHWREDCDVTRTHLLQ